MKKLRHKQSGFGTIELIVVGAVVVVLAVTGGLVYKYHFDHTKLANAASSSKQNTKQKSKQTIPPAATTYLDIKRWGVKLPLTNTISNAYYAVATNSTDTMWLSLNSLDGSDCDATKANTESSYISAIGSLEKVSPTEQDPAGSGTYMSEYPGALVGNYYYAYISETANKTCASQSTLNNINAAFSAAAKGIVASN